MAPHYPEGIKSFRPGLSAEDNPGSPSPGNPNAGPVFSLRIHAFEFPRSPGTLFRANGPSHTSLGQRPRKTCPQKNASSAIGANQPNPWRVPPFIGIGKKQPHHPKKDSRYKQPLAGFRIPTRSGTLASAANHCSTRADRQSHAPNHSLLHPVLFRRFPICSSWITRAQSKLQECLKPPRGVPVSRPA